MKRDQQMLRLVRVLTVIIGLSVSIALPAIYFALDYSNLSGAAATKASVKAESVGALANIAGPLWKYEGHRLREILELAPGRIEGETMFIRDAGGAIVAEAGPEPSRFAITEERLIYSQGRAIGVVQVLQPLAVLISETVEVLGLGLMLGILLFGVLELVPVRMLRNAMRTAQAEKQRAERNWEALNNEKERAEVTLHSIGDAVVTTDAAGVVEYLNPVAEQITGWKTGEARGRPLPEVLTLVYEATGEPIENPMHLALAERRIVPLRQNAALRRRDGSTICIEDTAAPIIDKAGKLTGGVLVFHDVSATRTMAERLSWQATHDALTGLANRAEFERRLEVACATARNGASHVLCYIDLDQFKIVNDTCGHAAGDQLLKQVTGALNTRLRGTDTLGRLGGDEFGILLENCQLEDAQNVVQQIIQTVLGQRFVWDGKTFNIGMSVGLVGIDAGTPSSGHALSAADAACYTAKEKGRGRVEIYEEYNDAARHQRDMDWVSRIHRALDENRFILYAQQFMALSGPHRHCRHLELLIRMVDEDGAVVSAGTFLPPAEHYGLMPELDRWVVKRAFSMLPEIIERVGEPEVLCSINLSGSSLNHGSLVSFIAEQAKAHDVATKNVCFEITETTAVNNLQVTAKFITELKALGFRFALDDFGTGSSSFLYLKNLPVDYVKIDGSFVRDILSNPVSRSMAKSINDIGHAMGLATIGEFAETAEIVQELKTMGVDFAQGYAVAKPVPIEQVGLRQLRLVSSSPAPRPVRPPPEGAPLPTASGV